MCVLGPVLRGRPRIFCGGCALSAYYWGLPGPKPWVLIAGAYPAPVPGVHFWTPKSEPKRRQPPSGWTPAVVQSVCIRLDAALPLNFCFLASDLCRVSRPASADALLKGQANLGSCVELPASVGDASAPVRKTRNNYQPEGCQAKCVMHRTGYEGQLEIQWQLGIFSDTDRLDKNGGPGSPRRFFGDFLCVQKVTRVRGGEPRKAEGRFRPLRNPPAGGTGKQRKELRHGAF